MDGVFGEIIAAIMEEGLVAAGERAIEEGFRAGANPAGDPRGSGSYQRYLCGERRPLHLNDE